MSDRTPGPESCPEADATDHPDSPRAILQGRRRQHAQQIACWELAAERLRIFSEHLATPLRPARDAWFGAWRGVAHAARAGDIDAAARAMAVAGTAFLTLDGVTGPWIVLANQWLSRARLVEKHFVSLVGGEGVEGFRPWPSADIPNLTRWAADGDEFRSWAYSIGQMGSLRSLLGTMRRHHTCDDMGWVSYCLDALAFVTAGAAEGEIREWLAVTRGPGWLMGATATVAASVVPPSADYEFWPEEVPDGDEQRETAAYLLRLADIAYGGSEHVRQFRTRHLAAPGPTPARPPEPPVRPSATAPPVTTNPTVAGFPDHSSYLPPGDLNSPAEAGPLAHRQLDEFLRCLDAADTKLHSFAGAMLPPALALWWVRAWADNFVARTRTVTRVEDIRATYHFARRLDRLLRITDAPADEPHPFNAEFTYYDRPLTRGDEEGRPGPAPLAHFGHDFERDHGYTPTPFPRSPEPVESIYPRLRCNEFLAWGGFLASPEPLSASQQEELSRVGCSDHGVNEWCRMFATHEIQCGRIAESVLDRLRWSVQHVADLMRIAPRVVPRGVPFSDALTAVAEWLEHAERVAALRAGGTAPAAERNAMVGEQDGEPLRPDKPSWDAEERVLTFGTWRFEYGKSADSQEAILAAFQSAGWPGVVRKSLPDNLGGVLRNMKKKLGGDCPITFDADGAKGVRWRANKTGTQVSSK